MKTLDKDSKTDIESLETSLTRKRYNRMSLIYDWMELIVEYRRFSHWRKDLWDKVCGEKILEVGVGTGKNIPYYPAGKEVVAIDISPGMLAKAEKVKKKLNHSVELGLADVQQLPFEDNSFDSVVSTFVFCSVPDPIKGLQEVKRVLKPGGQLYLLDHVLSKQPVLQWFMNKLNPLIVRISGANINRQTKKNIELAELELIETKQLWGDIIYRFMAREQE